MQLDSIGICGAGFFIEPSVFVTAYHLLNQNSFIPDGEYNNVSIYLINPYRDDPASSIIVQETDILEYAPDQGLTYIRIEGLHDFFEVERSELVKTGTEVFSVGFQTDNVLESISIEDNRIKLAAPIKQDYFIQQRVESLNLRSSDLNIAGKPAYILSTLGNNHGKILGGAPLLSKESKVIGMMSFFLPEEVSPEKNPVAIASQGF
jgi:hypothetical protein